MQLSLHNVSLTRHQQTICKNFSEKFQPGEFWVILGKNGVGKTCFIHSLCQLASFDSGDVYLEDQSIEKIPAKHRAKMLGLIEQTRPFVFPATVYETIASGRYPYSATNQNKPLMDNIVETLTLQDLKNRNVLDLSGGEQQRVALATLLAQDPACFILDEPCNHLDIHYQITLMQHLQSLTQTQQKTVIMVQHDINLVARYCTHALLFFGDAKVLSGPKADLLNQKNLSMLYQQPVREIQNGHDKFFVY